MSGGDLERDTPSAPLPRTLVALTRMGIEVSASVGTAALRRAVEGPMVPGWSWPVELTRAAARQMMENVSTKMDGPTVRGIEEVIDAATQIMWPPIGYRRSLVVKEESVEDVPVPGEWIQPVGYTFRGVVLYLHGGGYLGGSPWTHRGFTSKLAMRAHVGVFVPEYRLAPQHPFPAALDDALMAYRHMLDRGVPAERIVVAGDSAGGGLAAALALAIKDEQLEPPAGYLLISPEVDLTLTGDSVAGNSSTDILPHQIPTDGYVGSHDPADPLVSPLFGDLEGLPPMMVQVGGREMLRDSQLAFAQRAAAAGVDVWLHVEPDMFHVWPMLVPQLPVSAAALSRIVAFVEQRLGPLPIESSPGKLDGTGIGSQPVDVGSARAATAGSHPEAPRVVEAHAIAGSDRSTVTTAAQVLPGLNGKERKVATLAQLLANPHRPHDEVPVEP